MAARWRVWWVVGWMDGDRWRMRLVSIMVLLSLRLVSELGGGLMRMVWGLSGSLRLKCLAKRRLRSARAIASGNYGERGERLRDSRRAMRCSSKVVALGLTTSLVGLGRQGKRTEVAKMSAWGAVSGRRRSGGSGACRLLGATRRRLLGLGGLLVSWAKESGSIGIARIVKSGVPLFGA